MGPKSPLETGPRKPRTADHARKLTVITVSGQRHGAEFPNADSYAWHRIINLCGEGSCFWAGPRLDFVDSGFEIHQKPRGRYIGLVAWIVWAFSKSLRKARATQNGDLVFAAADPCGWIVAGMLSKLTKLPWLMEVSGSLLELPGDSFGSMKRKLLAASTVTAGKRATRIRTVSQSISVALAKKGLSAEVVPPRLTPIWEATPHRPQQPLTKRPWTVLAVGRLVPSKGFDLLIRAFSGLLEEPWKDTRLVVIGEGPEDGRLRRLSERHGLGRRVTFAGRYPPERVREEMLAGDLLVIPSRDEGLPRTLIEAISCCLPVPPQAR